MSRTRTHHKRAWPELPERMPVPAVVQPYPDHRAKDHSDRRSFQRVGQTRRDPLHPEAPSSVEQYLIEHSMTVHFHALSLHSPPWVHRVI
jgi:hypothetical protein